MFLSAAVFIVSAGIFICNLLNRREQEKTYETLSGLFLDKGIPAPEINQKPKMCQEGQSEAQEGSDDDGMIAAQDWRAWWEGRAKERFPVYQSIAKRNHDMAGWIRIEGTVIDYPVCHTPDDPQYYIHRDINRKNASCGTPFLDGACSLDEPRSSLLIYGHHMKNGQMFASLSNYTDYGYFLEHPYVQFDTLTEAGSYKIAAVVRLNPDEDGVLWHQLLFPENEAEFASAWETVQGRMFYETGIGLSEEDELLALVTCEYSQKNGRLMVIARRILPPGRDRA